MQELSAMEVSSVSGGLASFTEGGIAIMALGVAGTVATGGFGLVVGAACLYLGYLQGE
jgi:hypothetical protein